MPFDTWESYLYSNGTLRNLWGVEDENVLKVKEYRSAADRAEEIRSGQVSIPRTYDAEHVRAIHQHLFQDVYEWAGEYRTTGLRKGGHDFAMVYRTDRFPESVADRHLNDVNRLVTQTPWQELDRDQFAEKAAEVFSHLNEAHPFREGNGRTAKVFMDHVAEQSRFQLDRGRIAPELWNEASARSAPDPGSKDRYTPRHDAMTPLFREMATERTQEASIQRDQTFEQAAQARQQRDTEASQEQQEASQGVDGWGRYVGHTPSHQQEIEWSQQPPEQAREGAEPDPGSPSPEPVAIDKTGDRDATQAKGEEQMPQLSAQPEQAGQDHGADSQAQAQERLDQARQQGRSTERDREYGA